MEAHQHQSALTFGASVLVSPSKRWHSLMASKHSPLLKILSLAVCSYEFTLGSDAGYPFLPFFDACLHLLQRRSGRYIVLIAEDYHKFIFEIFIF